MRIALVAESPEYARVLQDAADRLSYPVIVQVTSLPALRATLKSVEADVIVIAVTRTDKRRLRQIERIYHTRPYPIVMFTQQGEAEIISAALKSGISAMVVDGLKSERVKPILDLAIIRFHETQTLQRQLHEVNTTPAERELIRQAAGILMGKAHISENAAQQALYKMALNRNKRTADIAQMLVSGERFQQQTLPARVALQWRPDTPAKCTGVRLKV
ncbi:MAG: ANTAR domain-containing protein [Gammaproteobacteria bacterium]